ncbi:hypothetical protein M758_11G144900 [Ceratodon purpureus]|nr:hypothetical protein M758_11G144900 [Ceratodon purpureus]
MLGTRQSRAEAGATECSSTLASQLQQAWLQSQIQSQSAKLQRRGLATARGKDVSVEKRAYQQQFHQVASDLSSIVADHNGVRGLVNYEELYFHKSRLETPEFPKRPVTPQLVSYSRKADLPQRSISGSVSDVSTLSSLSSSSSGSLSPSSQFTSGALQREAFCGALDVVDCGDSGARDLAAQTEPLVRFLDGLLVDEDLEKLDKFSSQEGFSYQAMAKEFDSLVSPVALESGSSESTDEDYDISWTTDMVSLRTEEDLTDKLIHAYTCNLYKHVTDVTENVDSSTWINERDAVTDHSDSQWDYYLERVRAKPEGRSLSSSLLQDHFFGKDMSLDTYSFSPGCVDLKELLLRCALVVSQEDVRSANDLIRELRHHSSAHGNALQRMAYYYMEALVAKMSGTGAQLYMAITSNTPSSATMVKAHRLFVDFSPYTKVSHFFSTKTILDAFEGAERVHLVDYGVSWGAQWPCLIQRLSQRREGPPHLRITCIDVPQSGGNRATANLHEVGRRLTQFAKLWNVPFEFQALSEKWETITPAQLCLKHDEVLAVHCQYRLKNLLDESIMAASPRKIVLDRIRSMNPKVRILLYLRT